MGLWLRFKVRVRVRNNVSIGNRGVSVRIKSLPKALASSRSGHSYLLVVI